MPQQLNKVSPTKNTLLKLKKQTRFLEEGHDLLERKRELLTRLVYERIGAYRRLRSDAEKALSEAIAASPSPTCAWAAAASTRHPSGPSRRYG